MTPRHCALPHILARPVRRSAALTRRPAVEKTGYTTADEELFDAYNNVRDLWKHPR